MKKNLKNLSLAVLSLTLTGCFRARMNIDVSEDGTFTGSETMLMSADMLTMEGDSIDDAIAALIEGEKENRPDAVFEPVKEEKNGIAYGGYKVNELPEDMFTVKKEGNTITVEIPTNMVEEQLEDEDEAEEFGVPADDEMFADEGDADDSGMSMAALKQYGAEATVTVNMPGKPKTNAGTVNGNTVTIDMLNEFDVPSIIITCSTGPNKGLIIGICAGAALLIAAAAGFLLMRRKQSMA